MRALGLRLRRLLGAVRRFHISNRWLLVALICVGQMCCMLAALGCFGRWLAHDLLAEMRAEALATNQEFAGQLVDVLRRLKVSDLRLGGADWERIQKTVERTKLPNDGFVCIVEGNEGRIICHPHLRSHSMLMSFQLGLKVLQQPAGGVSTVLTAAHDNIAATGWVQMPDGRHLVAVRDVPELNVRVLAHQPERAIAQVISDLNRTAWRAGVLFALLATVGTAGLTLLIVRLYEHRLTSLNRGLELQVERRSRALLRTRDAVIFGLAHLAESRHESTGEHLARIGRYVELLATEMARHCPDLNEAMVHSIVVASSLHDIGKVAIPDSVLLKPGRLTPRQRAVMREHTTIGGDCLEAIKRRLGDDDFLNVACQIAHCHHERWNGEGYPQGLIGNDIPLAARIVAVADVYDALTTERVYKQAMTHAQARSLIVRGSGRQFDPLVVESFLKLEEQFAHVASTITTTTTTDALAKLAA